MNDEKIWLETEDGQKLFIIKTEKCDMQKELTKTIDYLQQELQRKDNNWNELKEWLKNIAAGNWVEYNEAINDVLDKIKEIENDN